jgi:hypothetical protein
MERTIWAANSCHLDHLSSQAVTIRFSEGLVDLLQQDVLPRQRVGLDVAVVRFLLAVRQDLPHQVPRAVRMELRAPLGILGFGLGDDVSMVAAMSDCMGDEVCDAG